MKKYHKFAQRDNDFKPIPEISVQDKLPPGVYQINENIGGEIYFTKITTNHDELVDLPGTEYDLVVSEIEKFMKLETRKKFDKKGYIYKRGTLLHGKPGTGKTCIVNRVINKVTQEGGISLFSPNPALLEEAFRVLDSIQPETRVLVIFEELDQLIERYESNLLNLLDGEIQKTNVIYMATTNFIEQIPARIRRPGRFPSVIEVKYPQAKTRRFYLEKKLYDETGVDIDLWVQKTEGFSIDELKETVAQVICLEYDLDATVERIKENKNQSSEQELAEEYDGYEDDVERDAYEESKKWSFSTEKSRRR